MFNISDSSLFTTIDKDKEYSTHSSDYSFENFLTSEPACPITKYSIENLTSPTTTHPSSKLVLKSGCADPCNTITYMDGDN